MVINTLAKHIKYFDFLIVFSSLVSLILFTSPPSLQLVNAEDPYNVGYNHGCKHTKITEHHEKYINKLEKSPGNNTAEFMQGYNWDYKTCLTYDATENKSGSDYRYNLGSHYNKSCFELGYRDGLDDPFDLNHYDECGSAYYDGFINGCMSVSGNSAEVCEKFTDA